jgi:PTH1 family peptidyl-tRNA hydrolase
LSAQSARDTRGPGWWRWWLRRLFGGRGAVEDALAGVEASRARLIVGLGNPGPEYADTRHNIGFRVADEVARRRGARWVDRTADLHTLVAVGQGQEGEGEGEGEPTLVVAKPQTFMNRSGEALSALLATIHIEPRHVLIVYDDMDLPFGSLRLRERGSPGTHNGIRSVVRSLGTDAVARLRIGISQAAPGTATNHVLGEFEPGEQQAVDELVARAADAVLAWAIDGPVLAMNRYNKT